MLPEKIKKRYGFLVILGGYKIVKLETNVLIFAILSIRKMFNNGIKTRKIRKNVKKNCLEKYKIWKKRQTNKKTTNENTQKAVKFRKPELLQVLEVFRSNIYEKSYVRLKWLIPFDNSVFFRYVRKLKFDNFT